MHIHMPFPDILYDIFWADRMTFYLPPAYLMHQDTVRVSHSIAFSRCYSTEICVVVTYSPIVNITPFIITPWGEI